MTIEIDPSTCMLCGACTGVCHPGAIHLIVDTYIIDDNCTECEACIRVCPVGAIHRRGNDRKV